MRETKRDSAEERRRFCRLYLETMDVNAAAKRCGIADGCAMLERESVRREVQRQREAGGDVRREDVVRRLCALAFAPEADAIRLAWLENPAQAADGLNLSSVAEFKRSSTGGVEIKFIDRVKALEALERILGGGEDAEAPLAFLRALEEAGEEREP